MRSHGISGIFFGDHSRQSSSRRARQAVAVAALAILSVGCAVGSRVSLPPLPVVALFDLLSALLPAGSSGGSYGPAAVSTNLSATGTGTVSACQFVSPVGTAPGSNVVPAGLTITVGTPPGGAPNTGCVIAGVIGDSNGNGVIDAGEGVAPGTYTFTVRAADSSSPPQSDTQTYTIIISSLQIAVTDSPDPTVTGQNITVTWTFTVSGSAATPNQQALVELLGPTMLVEDSCVANLTALTCGPLQSTTSGAHTVRLTYPNPPATDANFPGTTTASAAHTVNVAPTTTTVTTTPDPSVTGQMYAANVTVATNAPGGGAATGTVAISDGLGNSCNAVLTPGANQSTGTCNLNGPTAGARTVTASYPGDANYAASMGTDPHTVNPAATTTAITSDAPDPSVTGEPYVVNWTVTVNAPGAGTPTGTVTVDDGTGAMCSAAVAAGTCTITSVTAGAKTLTANYSGDANFNASSDTEAHTVNPASTTTTITSDLPDPSLTGETYVINVTVDTNAPGTGQPTGTVTINDGQGQNCMAVLAAGPGANQSTATCMITSITTAVTTLTANYPGDPNFAASSDTEAHTVTLAPTTTTITSDTPDPSAVGEAITVNVTVAPNPPGTGAPTGSVMISDGFGGTCNIAALTPGANQSTGSCMLTSTTTSVTTLTATYSGDANFATSMGNAAHVVTLATTTTTLASGLNPSTFGQSVTFTATVAVNPPGMGTPTGTVSFVDTTTATALCTNVPLAGNSAQCMTAGLAAGLHNVQATYNGDVNFSASMSNIVAQTVNQSATTTALMSSLNPSVFTQAVTFTATIAPVAPGAGTPTGTVNFVDNTLAVSLTGCAAVPVMGGVAMCTVTDLQAGNHNVQANYSGDANFQLSLSNIVAQTVNPNTSTTLMSSTNPSEFQQLISFTATVTDLPGGNPVLLGDVTFVDTSTMTVLCANVPLILGQAVCNTSTLSVATHNVQATYNGAAGAFSVSISNVVAQVVNQAATSSLLTLTAGTNPSTVGDSLTFTATLLVNGPGSGAPTAPTGTVTFTNTTTAAVLCLNVPLNVLTQDASCTTTALPAGMNDIRATYSGDTNFIGNMSNLLNQTVNQANATIMLMSSANPSQFQQTVTYTATVSGGGPVPTGTVTFFNVTTAANVAGCVNVALVAGVANCMNNTLPVGMTDLRADYSGDANYAAGSSANLTQTVNAATTNTAVTSNIDPSVFGQTVTLTATVTTPVGGVAPTAPTGTVDFFDGGVGIAGCAGVAINASQQATCMVATLAVGANNITANYTSGDANFLSSMSGIFVQDVNASPTTTAPIANANAATVTGQQYTVTVTVTASGGGMGQPDGDVDIDDGEGNTCNTGPLTPGGANDSTGSCMITSMSGGVPGKTISATFNPGGSGNFATSSGTDAHTVNPAATTTVINTKSADPTVSGEDFDVTVTVTTNAPGAGESTGTVIVQDDDANPTDSCMAVLTPGAPGSNTSTGTCTILNSRSQNNATDNLEASYQGDGNFAVSTSALFPHTVNKAGTGFPITPTKMPDPSTAGQIYTVNATVNGGVAGGEGQPTGTVDVTDGFGGMCTIMLSPGPGANESSGSCMMTSTSTASNNLDFTYSGDGDFNGVMTNIAHTVVMGIVTTPAAPGGIMGDGVDGRAIGGGSAGVDGVAFEVIGASGGVANCVFGGTPPTGVTVAPGMTSGAADACVMAGAPTQTGTFMFTITVTDGAANMATTSTITWTVNASLAFTSTGMPGPAVDQRNYNFLMTASGGIGVKSFDNNGTALATQDVDCTSFAIAVAGSLTATPAALQAGNNVCDFTARVQDMASTSTAAGSATQAHSIPLNAALAVTPATIPNGKRQATYNPTGPGFTVTATGGTGISLMWTPSANFTLTAGNWVGNVGTACEGLQFPQAPGGNTTTITGTPVNAGTLPGAFSATCSFTMQADDASNGPTAGGNDTQAYSPIIFNTLAFAAGTGTDTIEVVNTDTNAFVASIGSLNATPDQIAVSPDGRYVFSTSPTSDEIVVVDVATAAPIGNSPFNVGASCNGPLGVATTLTAAGVRRIFVACSVNAGGSPDERVVTYDFDPTGGAGGNGALAVAATADFTGGGGEDHDPQRLAITPDGSTVFVVFRSSIAAGGEWGRVNAATGAIIQNGGNDFTNFSPACGTVTGIAIAQTAQAGNPVEAYVACTGPDNIAILDTGTLAQAAANITVGSNPNSIAFVPGANSPRAYVTLNGADQIAVIDTAARTATNLNLPSPNAAIDTDSDPFGITIPVPPNNAPTVEIFTSLSGAATPSPGVNVIADPATVASVGATIGTTASSAPRGIAHIPRPRQ